MGIPEEEGEEKGTERLFKQISNEIFPNIWKELKLQTQEELKLQTHRTTDYLNAKRLSPRHIILKCQKLIKKKKFSR